MIVLPMQWHIEYIHLLSMGSNSVVYRSHFSMWDKNSQSYFIISQNNSPCIWLYGSHFTTWGKNWQRYFLILWFNSYFPSFVTSIEISYYMWWRIFHVNPTGSDSYYRRIPFLSRKSHGKCIHSPSMRPYWMVCMSFATWDELSRSYFII